MMPENLVIESSIPIIPALQERTEPENPWEPVMLVEEDTEPPSVRVYFVAINEDSLAEGHSWSEANKDKILIIEIFQSFVVTYPINVRRDKPDYLQPKYGRITSLTLDWFDQGWIEEPEAVKEMLEHFPEGFSKQFQYGLGLKWEYRFLIESIANIEGIEHIVFSKTEITRAEGDIYFFNMRDYQTLRRTIDNISRRYQREARGDKLLLCYANILRKHDPQKYPIQTKRPKAGAIYELLNSLDNKVKLGKRDQESMIRLVQGNKEELVKDHHNALLQLKTDIESVTLGQIISTIEEMLSKNLSETHWQKFFMDNSFVLTLAFSYPVTLVQDQAHVGGADIRGIGTKITDFLVSNRFTGNLAVFEIKKPDSALLSSVEYRTNLFRNSKELGGAIAQVQDQKFQLQNNFTNLAYQSGWNDFHAFNVQCVVIIGRSPADNHEKKSFEFIRHSLKDVQIITYDEMLDKVRQIHQLFVAGKAKEEETQDLF
ncbi:Shedu immune nuclease family protein [Geotalea toluenoxydans]|uniref:Shedu immune nuclease family protein n=1 Tax=Geotalea toluenoxydans TaxID=421624 RepID=UPI001FB1E68F|nr:Shedu immune nuclease family protein [Geotalea toluenoxydans]